MQINIPLPVRYNGVAYSAGAQTVADATASEMISLGIAAPVAAPIPSWQATLRDQLAAIGLPMSFGLRPSLLASLVANSSASRASGIVTVAATAHGITTGATYVGYRFYYPGSASLIAGWYDSILTIPDANTLTFSAPGTDFVSESVNSGAAWTSITEFTGIIIPAGSIRDQSKLRVNISRDGSTSASTKTIYSYFGGSSVSFHSSTTLPRAEISLSMRCIGNSKQIGFSSPDGSGSSSALNTLSKDITADQILSLRGGISAASDFLVIYGSTVEILS